LWKKISQIFNIISDFWSNFLDEDSSSFYGGKRLNGDEFTEGGLYKHLHFLTNLIPKGVYGTIITFSFFCCCCCCCCWKIGIYDYV